MLRVSRYMQEIVQTTPRRAPSVRREPPGPVVIWNLVRRCNLTCMHCYSISTDIDFPGELKAARVTAVILSGGEPLLRKNIFEIAERIAATGFDYVGISLDGLPATHDRIRLGYARSGAPKEIVRGNNDAYGVYVLDDFFFTPDFAMLVGAQRAIATLDLPGLPHLSSG